CAITYYSLSARCPAIVVLVPSAGQHCGAGLCTDDKRSETAPIAQENVQIANCGSIDAGKLAYRRVAGFFTKRYTKRSRHTGTTIVPAVSATAIRCGSMSSRPWAWVSEPPAI